MWRKGDPLHCGWECKLIQSLWRTEWIFLNKLSMKLPYDPAIPLLRTDPEKKHNSKIYVYPNVHCGRIYNSQDTEATYMSIDRWMDKAVMVHTYKGILLSHKRNEFESVKLRLMNLNPLYRVESVIKRENKYIHNLEKCYWWTYLQGRNTDADIENRFVNTVAEGKDGTNEESTTEKYTLPCVKQIASGKSLCDDKGWDGGVGGRLKLYV